PLVEKRFAAMEQLARAGILTGTCMMPILPKLCDDDANLQYVTKWTAEHGGQFVLAGGLTMADQQRDFFLGVLDERFPELADHYRDLYPEGSYGPACSNWNQIALRLKELCEQYGISDRIPRPIIPGDKRTLNKRIVEALAKELYYMELNGEPSRRVWAYRKAAWAIEDTPSGPGLDLPPDGCERPGRHRECRPQTSASRGGSDPAMGMTCSLQLAGFCRVMMLLVCVRAEVSPTAPTRAACPSSREPAARLGHIRPD
ncbi:MAG TPA: helix-hairpin-helix domain-containing protein, partial [Anaerolineae bacterium]|nr:helix-hairpin-helix domain-containing protein [Anaerolineae bacterium]